MVLCIFPLSVSFNCHHMHWYQSGFMRWREGSDWCVISNTWTKIWPLKWNIFRWKYSREEESLKISFFVICPVFRETRMWGQVWINDHIFGRLLDPQEDWICSDLDPTDFGDQPVLLYGTIQIHNTYHKYTLEHRFKYISCQKASPFYEGNCFVYSQTH